jgi:RNA polymerase sigma factor (sigma-70 family)
MSTGGRRLPFPPVPAGRTLDDLEQFWSDWEPVIRRVAKSKLRIARVPRGLAEADDAVQHVYLELHEQWQDPDFADADPGRIALGSILADFVRLQVKELKNRRNQMSGQDGWHDPLFDQPAPEPSPDDLLLQQEVERYLREALNQLPDLQRQAVEMTVEGELSRDQVADRMGVKTGTVSSHRARGLRKLADILGPIVTSIVNLIHVLGNGGAIGSAVFVGTLLALLVLALLVG